MLALPLCGFADTIFVKEARMLHPIVMQRPYETDSTDMKAKKFDIQELLTENTHLLHRELNAENSSTLQRNARLSVPTEEGKAIVSMLRFSVETPKYIKGTLKIDGIQHHKVFLGNKEVSGGKLELIPGRKEISVLCLTQPESKDSFNIRIEGKSLSGLTVNPMGKRPYTMDEMLLGEHYSRVLLSPSGKYLVTVAYDTREDGTNVYRTTLSETESQRIIMQRSEYQSLTWLPRRDVLYYTRQSGKNRQLVFYNPQDGCEVVAGNYLPAGNFSIAPTEDYLIFSKSQEGAKEQNGMKRLIEPDDRQPGWRNRNALYRFDLATGQMQRLTFGSTSVWLSDISADGKHLLLSLSRMDTKRRPFSRTTLLRMEAFTGKVDTLLSDTAHISAARFSPDAKQLLITASPNAFDGIGSEVKPGQTPNAFDYRLYLYDISAKAARPLLCGFAPTVGRCLWSKADGYIYFRATEGCNETLFRLDPETEEVVRYNLPVSYVQDFSIAMGQKQPQAVFFGQTGERARELFACRLNSATPKVKRIGDIDFDTLYKDVAIGTCSDWDFRSSRGDTIRGFRFLPPAYDATKTYPLIVYYYGGCVPTPKMLEFQYPLQVLAAQGYVVYVVNPSGATGFGQEFAARHVNTWGEGSANDIIEGTKAFLAAHPNVDKTKVGCMGASYGGFMTQYLQTRTDIFAAAISHAGISNIASYWGGGYWGYTYGEVAQYGSFPWNNPDLYVKQSPLFNADKINTPLLLLHGTADTNVPTDESRQLFTALRILGKPVSYVQIDGENHVIVKHDKRIAWQNTIFAWFAHWLKGEKEWWQELYPGDTFGQPSDSH